MSKQQVFLGLFGLAAAGIAIGVIANRFIASRKPWVAAEPAQLAAASLAYLSRELDELAPESSGFEPSPVSDGYVSARPHAYTRRSASADDYDAIGADELGSAFLARATDASGAEREFGDETDEGDLAGFQIVQPRTS